MLNTPKAKDTSHLKARNKEFNRYKKFIAEATNGLTCSGCNGNIPQGDVYTDGLDDLGSGKFCDSCWDKIDKNRVKNFTDPELYTSEQKRRLVAMGYPIGMASMPQKPGGVSTIHKSTTGYTNQWSAKCRHFEKLDMGENGGSFWVSSSFHDDARLHGEADAALFFANSWGSKIAPIFQVWREGDGSIKLPESAPEMTGPVVFVDWKDHAAPPSGIVTWVDWAAGLINQGKMVQIGCMGGHGRTGTFIALVALKLGLVNNALQAHYFTWKNVCYNTIESVAQEKTIYAFAGELSHYKTTDVMDFKKACSNSEPKEGVKNEKPAPKVVTPKKEKKKAGKGGART